MPKELDLLYPLYLDVPMLAGLLTGASQENEDLSQEKIQALLAETGNPVQQKYAVNLLLSRLLNHWEATDSLADVDETPELKVGSLVEVTGTFYRNPLAVSLEAFLQVMNISGFSLDQPPTSPAPSPLRRGPAVVAPTSDASSEEANFFRVFQRLRDEISQAKVQDLVIYPSETDLNVVVSVLVAGLPENQIEVLLNGEFRVIGKVSQVLEVGEELSLHQRTSFGYIQTELFETSFADLKDIPWIALTNPASFVVGPAIQIVPLAILA